MPSCISAGADQDREHDVDDGGRQRHAEEQIEPIAVMRSSTIDVIAGKCDQQESELESQAGEMEARR